MFERRLRILLVLFVLPVVGLLARLVQLQVVNAAQYREESGRLLLRDTVYYPSLRGDITDYDGQVRLAYDAPSWNICVHYKLLSEENQYLQMLAVQAPRYRGLDAAAAEAALAEDIDASWRAIAAVSGRALGDVRAAGEREAKRVQTIKSIVEKRRGVQTVIAQETMFHPVVRGLDQHQQALAREKLGTYPWVTVEADQRRQYAGGPAFGHLLGRLGQVGPADVEKDWFSDLPLGELYEYVGGDLKGVSGVEQMGERWLRGRRGRRREDINGNLVNDPLPADPVNGKTLRLTINYALQQKCYEILKAAVEEPDPTRAPYKTGGAAVLIDVPSRQVLAAVSYPSYDPNASGNDLVKLEEDELHQPLICRSLQMRYPPGSTVKPMLLAGALADGVASPGTTVNCEGHLFSGQPDRWRCTAAHGTADPVFAVQHSCNIFFYRLGERMAEKGGIRLIADWMGRFGFGRPTGTGFPVEGSGHLPEDTNPGNARLAAIGQADTDTTPIQIANMTASIASGVYRETVLWADDPRPRPTKKLPISDATWQLVRRGMYRAVNEPGGTAYKVFSGMKLTEKGDYIVIGKTGSATGQRRVLQRNYTCTFPDGSTRVEVGDSLRGMQNRYPDAKVTPGEAVTWLPPEGVDPTHAWFTGYITTKQRYLESNNAGRLNVAFAVIIEYGGHGGEGAAPAAVRMVRAVLEQQGEAVAPEPEVLNP